MPITQNIAQAINDKVMLYCNSKDYFTHENRSTIAKSLTMLFSAIVNETDMTDAELFDCIPEVKTEVEAILDVLTGAKK